VQFPFFVYWLWLSLRAKSLFFFSASNPGIVLGGMLGESKYDVLNLIPTQYKPKTIIIRHPFSFHQVMTLFHENNFHFPVIFKPDIGERGYRVKRIFNEQDVEQYVRTFNRDFLIQELIDLPIECGVFYTRFPDEGAGKVTSLVLKEMLTVTGDGTATLEELILDKPRAKLQWDVLKISHQENLANVFPAGRTIELNPIGNHCLGTKFLSGEHLINEQLSKTFDTISKQVNGFYFGRYDLRCASIEALYVGDVKIMELNGCGAEPAHIYQPEFSLWKALSVLRTHWKNLFIVSVQNHRKGIPYPTFTEGKAIYKKFKSALS
jgi:hypothetical protein